MGNDVSSLAREVSSLDGRVGALESEMTAAESDIEQLHDDVQMLSEGESRGALNLWLKLLGGAGDIIGFGVPATAAILKGIAVGGNVILWLEEYFEADAQDPTPKHTLKIGQGIDKVEITKDTVIDGNVVMGVGTQILNTTSTSANNAMLGYHEYDSGWKAVEVGNEECHLTLNTTNTNDDVGDHILVNIKNGNTEESPRVLAYLDEIPPASTQYWTINGDGMLTTPPEIGNIVLPITQVRTLVCNDIVGEVEIAGNTTIHGNLTVSGTINGGSTTITHRTNIIGYTPQTIGCFCESTNELADVYGADYTPTLDRATDAIVFRALYSGGIV
jgi:hypothetical protein